MNRKIFTYFNIIFMVLTLAACGPSDSGHEAGTIGGTETGHAGEIASGTTPWASDEATTGEGSGTTAGAAAETAADETAAEKPGLSDAEFLTNLVKGLEARWALTDSEKYSEEALEDMSLKEYQETYALFVQAEYDAIGSLADYGLQDDKIKTLAETYMKGLKLQKKGVKFQGTDNYIRFGKTWELGYSYRAAAAADLCKEYGLTVDKKYQADFEELTAAGKAAKKEVAIQEYTKSLETTLKYKKDKKISDESVEYYKTIVENTSGETIDSMEITVKFLDQAGEVLEKRSDYIYEFKPGDKVKSWMQYDPAFGKFDSMKITTVSY